MKTLRFYFLLFFIANSDALFGYSAEKKNPPYNELAIGLPFDGGVMLMYSRKYRMTRFLDAGFFVGGGHVNREFDLVLTPADDVQVETNALVLPFLGPQLSLNFKFIGLSLGYGVFWAKTDIEMEGALVGHLTGDVSGWGSGFYSPLLVLDFYNRKHDVVFGFGLGGFLGTSYKTLSASSGNTVVQTDESPVQTLTFHLRMLWADGRKERLSQAESLDEF